MIWLPGSPVFLHVTLKNWEETGDEANFIDQTHPSTHPFIPAATPYHTGAIQLINMNKVNMKRALMERKGREVEAVRKLQDFYLSCLNVEVANSLGVGPLIDLIAQTG